MPGRFAETVGLDDSFDFFFLGRIPTLARARLEASMPGRWCGGGGGFNAGQVARPGGYAGQVRRNFRQ